VASLLTPHEIFDFAGAPLWVRGFAFGFLIAASPGPIFFLCLRRTLLRGWPTGVVSGLGVATADAFYAAIAVFGIAAVTTVLTGGAKPLTLVGGAALIGIGLSAVREKPREVGSSVQATGRGFVRAYASTLGLTVTNPTTVVSFMALAAALGAGLRGGFGPPAVVVAGVALGSATWWCVLAALAALLRTRITPSVARWIGLVSGLAIAAIGVVAVVAALRSS
jgi:threonine/homoserine/homoserine lactone efflux protein